MRTTPGCVDTSNIVYVCRAEHGIDHIRLREMLGYFIDENTRRMAKAAEALAAGDREALRDLAHAIQGSAALFGAAHLATLAFALEEEAARASGEALRSAVHAVATEFEAVQQSLHALHPEALGTPTRES